MCDCKRDTCWDSTKGTPAEGLNALHWDFSHGRFFIRRSGALYLAQRMDGQSSTRCRPICQSMAQRSASTGRAPWFPSVDLPGRLAPLWFLRVAFKLTHCSGKCVPKSTLASEAEAKRAAVLSKARTPRRNASLAREPCSRKDGLLTFGGRGVVVGECGPQAVVRRPQRRGRADLSPGPPGRSSRSARTSASKRAHSHIFSCLF